MQGERISVKRLGGATTTGATVGQPGPSSRGWWFDLGERKPGEPPPQSLHVQWSAPAEFSAAVRFETSDDLRA